MRTKSSEKVLSQNQFSNIVKKAYDQGMTDQGITVEKLINQLKIELLKIKTN